MHAVEVRHLGNLHTIYRCLGFPESNCHFNLKINFKNCPSYAFKFLKYLVWPQCSGTYLKQMVQGITSLKGRGFSSVRIACIATGEKIQSSAARPQRPQANWSGFTEGCVTYSGTRPTLPPARLQKTLQHMASLLLRKKYRSATEKFGV